MKRITQLGHWISQAKGRQIPRTRRAKHFRGHFEQLETRSMLSASAGPDGPAVDLPQFDAPDLVGPIGQPEYVALIVASPAPEATAFEPVGDGPSFVVGPPPRGPQKLVDDTSSTLFMGIAYGASPNPGEVHVRAMKVSDNGGPELDITQIDQSVPIAVLPRFVNAVEHYFDPGNDYLWRVAGFKSYISDEVREFEIKSLELSASLESSASVAASAGQGGPSASSSQRAYDSAFQSYSAQPLLLTLDSTTTSAVGSLSFTDTHLNVDDGQGGFVELDGSSLADNAFAHRSAADAESTAIDAVMASLYDSYPAANGTDDLSLVGYAEGGDLSAVADGQAMIDVSGQGGMVLLRSAASHDDLASLVGANDTPINWSVPTASGKLEAAVGIYQAFDVATGDLTSSPVAVPTAVVAPAAKHDAAAKNHVSADKAAKPVLDQASAWVGAFTVAAVAGASKKRRKSRTQA